MKAAYRIPKATCRHCSKTYTPKSGDRTTFCSRDCAYALRAAERKARFSVVKPCELCGSFVRGSALVCSTCRPELDRKRSRAANLEKHAPAARNCPGCGALFTPLYGHSHARYCDPSCATQTVRHNRKRRLRKARVSGVVVGRVRIFERDGWRCHWCGVDTPRALMGTHAQAAPELDHVVALAAGGKHVPENVVCACRACNGIKSDKPLATFRREMEARIVARARAAIADIEAASVELRRLSCEERAHAHSA